MSSSNAPRHRRRLFAPITPGAARAVVVLFVLSLVIGGLNFGWTARTVNGATHRARALCRFDADLGTAPIVVPGGGKPSLLGVTIISDARMAWHQAGCPGRLGAPDPTFTRWAKYYHLPGG